MSALGNDWLIPALLAAGALLLLVFVLLLALLIRQGRMHRLQAAENNRHEQAMNEIRHALGQQIDAMYDDQRLVIQNLQNRTLDAIDRMDQDRHRDSGELQDRLLMTLNQHEQRLNAFRGEINALNDRLTDEMQKLRTETERQLLTIRQTVDEKLTETLDRRLSQSFRQVTTSLEQVYQGLGEMQHLAEGVGDLKKVLTNVKTRGIWGEMLLGSLLKEVLTPEQYAENIAVQPGSSQRVEYALRLPGKSGDTVWLPIDSKFPVEDYVRLNDAVQNGDKAQAEEARKQLSLSIRNEAKRIGKYIVLPHTTDFAVMFLPVEGLYAEAAQTPGLTEELQRTYRVITAGPSTLLALLNALQMGFRTLAIEKRTGEVWQLLTEVKRDFLTFTEALEATRSRLQQAQDTIDKAYSRTRSLKKKLGDVETLNLNDPVPTVPSEQE